MAAKAVSTVVRPDGVELAREFLTTVSWAYCSSRSKRESPFSQPLPTTSGCGSEPVCCQAGACRGRWQAGGHEEGAIHAGTVDAVERSDRDRIFSRAVRGVAFPPTLDEVNELIEDTVVLAEENGALISEPLDMKTREAKQDDVVEQQLHAIEVLRAQLHAHGIQPAV